MPHLERLLSYPHQQPTDPQGEDGGHPWADQGYPPTASFPAYGPDRQGEPPHPTRPRRSNVPLVAVIMAVTVLLCGGTAVAGVLVARYVTDRAKEAVEPITDLPTLPTEVPALPTEVPTLPTGLPDLPGLPAVPRPDPSREAATTVKVRYEVTGDGPADITYLEKLGEAPKRVSNAELPWRKEVSMSGATLVSVVAFRTGTREGTIRCRARVDGEEVAEREATGSIAVVTCSKVVLD
jgi:hypothetical protein